MRCGLEPLTPPRCLHQVRSRSSSARPSSWPARGFPGDPNVRHAHANSIEAEIRYDRDMFRLRIRDDGKGIDSSVLNEGTRTGHWGLPGMQERAKTIGGHLKIWSEPGAGTEAEVTVPARIAYEKFSNNGWWARLGRRLRLTAPNREA